MSLQGTAHVGSPLARFEAACLGIGFPLADLQLDMVVWAAADLQVGWMARAALGPPAGPGYDAVFLAWGWMWVSCWPPALACVAWEASVEQ